VASAAVLVALDLRDFARRIVAAAPGHDSRAFDRAAVDLALALAAAPDRRTAGETRPRLRDRATAGRNALASEPFARTAAALAACSASWDSLARAPTIDARVRAEGRALIVTLGDMVHAIVQRLGRGRSVAGA